MAIFVASGTKLASGSGRTFHEWWPSFVETRNTAGAGYTNSAARQGINAAGGASVATGGASGSAAIAGIFKGTIPVRFRNLVAGDLVDLTFGRYFYPMTEQRGDNDVGNPMRVFRYLADVAYPALGGALGAAADLGMELRCGNISSMNNGALRPGVMFGPVDANNIGLRIRLAFGGAYTLDRQMTFAQAGVTDITTFNLWELRIVGGDKAGPAQLKAFINGRQFGANVVMGAAAAIVPAPDAAGGGFNGYQWRFINTNTGAYDCYVNQVHSIISAFEDDGG